MKYTVELTALAEREIDEAYLRIAADSPMNALNWLVGIREAILNLSSFPKKCPSAIERALGSAGVRQLVFGRYRVLFVIDGSVVRVLHVRHASRRAARRRDLRL